MTTITLPPMPRTLASALTTIQRDKHMREGISALRSRRSDFDTELAMILTGAAMVPEARNHLVRKLQDAWKRRTYATFRDNLRVIGTPDEVIVGAGVHAAIYCAVRVLSGHPKPIVLERDRPGGVFATTLYRPAWRLNNRNWPGDPGIPDEPFLGSLAFLPGFPVQPAQLSGAEYQDNTDIAFAVMTALAMYADVYTGVEVNTAASTSGSFSGDFEVTTSDDNFYANRVIDARGLGDPREPSGTTPASNMNFIEFMRRMDDPFPLRGMHRVGVRGSGDAAKCVVENLLGIGPSHGFSSVAMDSPDRIDFYAPGLPTTRENWRVQERGRYRNLGSYLTRELGNNDLGRVRLYSENGQIVPSYPGILMNERSYDHTVSATGWLPPAGLFSTDYGAELFPRSGTLIARSYNGPRNNAFAIGPRADIPWSDSERDRGVDNRRANLVSLWRLAPRTAALAARLT